jgi:hypothetical protein
MNPIGQEAKGVGPSLVIDIRQDDIENQADSRPIMAFLRARRPLWDGY